MDKEFERAHKVLIAAMYEEADRLKGGDNTEAHK